MTVYELPDGRLVVPMRAESEGVIGDGMVPIDESHPDYQKWRDWLDRTGTETERVESWPPEE